MKREVQRLTAAAGLGILVLLVMMGVKVTEWQYIAAKVAPDNLESSWICRAQCISEADTELCSSELVDGVCESPWHVRQATVTECRAWVEAPCEGIGSDGGVATGAIVEPSLIELAAPLSERQ